MVENNCNVEMPDVGRGVRREGRRWFYIEVVGQPPWVPKVTGLLSRTSSGHMRFGFR